MFRGAFKRVQALPASSRLFTSAFSSLLKKTATISPTYLQKAVVLGTLMTSTYVWSVQRADACGIVGYIGDENAVDFLLEGLHILQNRGYDSMGVATIHSDGKLLTSKFASKGSTSDSIDLLTQNAPPVHKGDSIGIAHSRWATHGGKTDANAHPHSDWKNRIALVHNGTIENYAELKEEMEKSGIPFRSQTDTEVIANLVGVYLDKGMSFVDSVKATFGRLEGTWGIAMIHRDYPGQLIAARNGSPLVVGLGENCTFVASELAAFSRHTTQYIALKDGEMAILEKSGVSSLDQARIQTAPKEVIEMSPEPYPHWTKKEIMEQPEAIARTLGYGGRFHPDGRVKLGGLDNNRDTLLGIKNLMLAGCGTSFFAGLYGVHLMQYLKCFDTVQCLDAAEVTQDTFPAQAAGLCVLSQSGETKDTHRTVLEADSMLIPTFSVVNQVGSLISRTTNCGVYLNAGREHAVASTKAFTTQVTALALVAGWFSQNRLQDHVRNPKRDQLVEALHRLPIYAGMTLKSYDQVKQIAQTLKGQQHMFILGKGFGEPIAREGALKIKEVSYIHAEGYSGGALKHGPFALLDQGTPVILLIFNDRHAELMKTAAHEVRARGAYTVVITDKPVSEVEKVADEIISVPSNGPLTALLATIPLQILAYEISVAKGINPDKPRHLAKAVTTD